MYKTQNLTLEQKRDICQLAYESCFNWWVDTLDCSISFHRKRIDLTFEEIMEKLDETSLFFMIHRNLDPENHLEVGFRTGSDVEYFLWLQVDPKFIPELTKGLDEFS
jgi:hypothetical protein